ncbi:MULTISPECIES: hypothetical protein [Calothrix]|uniref:Uncharacterized protein n=2 Tax=Calothrix TaxID=1186 RepID=A0ABR8A3E3_9CYAN|nr:MULTISPECIES: hypothetical protein [Calothrix]MBD2194416.1 hypothetical protein [Calothrix parietina FACHB-288]MBD2223198.1 hypothetical protein [Calothrix anomala FACHB-343]
MHIYSEAIALIPDEKQYKKNPIFLLSPLKKLTAKFIVVSVLINTIKLLPGLLFF